MIGQDISIQVSYSCVSTTKTIMHHFRKDLLKSPISPHEESVLSQEEKSHRFGIPPLVDRRQDIKLNIEKSETVSAQF